METGRRYEVFTSDGLAYGYFLDDRLYEYLTSTCVGSLNDFGQLVHEEELLGHMDGEQLLMSDGTLLSIRQHADI